MTSDPTASSRAADGRPLLFALAAWLGAWMATSGLPDVWWALVAGLLMAAVVTGRRRSRLGAIVLLVLAASFVGGWARVVVLADSPVRQLAEQKATGRLDLEVRGGLRESPATATRQASWRADATLVRVDARGRVWSTHVPVRVQVSGDALASWREVPLGARVSALGSFSVPDADAGLSAQVRLRGAPRLVAPPGPLEAAVQRLRSGLRRACEPLAPEPRALVPALVVGDTTAMPRDVVEAFKTTGLTHLTAVSGANLVLLLGFIRSVAVRVGFHGRRLTALLIATVFGFVALCLGEPSVVRAAAMGLVGLAALGAGGRGEGLRYLAAAVLGLMFFDPWLARSWGFALSVTASAGLLWWAGPWTRLLSRWLPPPLAEALAVPLSAQLATQPLVTALAGQISLVGILANAVAGPLVGPATVLGFLAAGLSVILPMGSSALAWCAGWFAQALCWIARMGAAVPGASATWPASPVGLLLVTLICLFAGVVAPWVFARPIVTVALCGALVAALCRTPTPPGWPPPAWSVVTCDVGQGDATVLRASARQAVVVDTGPDPSLLNRCLDQLGIQDVPLVVLTHLHADHVGGMPALAGRRVRTVATSGVRTPSSGQAAVEALVMRGAQHVTVDAGSVVSLGAAHIQVLSSAAVAEVSSGPEGESPAENDASLILRAEVGGVSMLLSGDREQLGQAAATRATPSSARDVDVLLVPHHGSSGQEPRYLAEATPEVVLISVGAKNDYGHPTAKTLRTLAGLTPNVLRTDQRGSIAVARVDGRLTATAQRAPA